MFTRRNFLLASATAPIAAAPAPAIKSIERLTIMKGREGGTTWFHPRAGRIPHKSQPVIFMTLQSITGSDVFGHVHWTKSEDLGATWSTPEPIPGFGRTRHPDGMEEGVCDVVPEYHAPTRSIIAMGHNVYYKAGKLTQPSEKRWPVYSVRSADGQWSPLHRLVWEDPEATAMYTSGCSQRITLPGGDLLLALSFGPLGRADRAVTTVRCRFNAGRLEVAATGNRLHLAAGRGLLEPSLATLAGRYYMTIRAEDNHGYVTSSADGLKWNEMQPWRWDDGEAVTMSTTQQRWLPHSDRLLLVYTRKAAENTNVMRWRAPLYVAEVDAERMVLIRASEQIVFPMSGDGVKDPDSVAHHGNFHTTAVTPDVSIVTVGETLPKKGFRGDTLLARIHWSRPNRNVGA